MRKIVHKLFWAWDYEKEEVWLNQMAEQGWAMVSYGFCRYEFEECEPGEYELRIQMLENPLSDPESSKYMEFLESTGVEHVGSWLKWIYLRKKKADGEFQVFSDYESKIKHLSRIMNFLLVLGVLNLYIGIQNIFMLITLTSGFNSIGFINLALGVVVMIKYAQLHKIRKKLREDSVIFE